jgi:hypothetical protein
MRRVSRSAFCLSVGLAAAVAACSRPSTSLSQPIAAAATSSSGSGYLPLNITHDDPPIVGSRAHVTATGLPAGKTVDVTWGTVTGGWVIEDYYHFRGKKYSETSTSLGKFTTDKNGALDANFAIPEDYGGVHEVIALVDGKPIAQGGVNVSQSFALSPTSGPVGTPIELKVTGLGWRTMESTWVVNWDNQELGFITAASTRGSAVGRFRAAGPSGDHAVKLYTGWQGQAYLNYEQSPVAALPRPQFTFHTTAGSAGETAYAERYQQQPLPVSDLKTGATLTVTPTQGRVGTPTKLAGSGFKAGAPLQVVWETYVGSRVSGEGFTPKERVVGELKAGPDGRVDSSLTVPDDLGGLHTLTLKSGDEAVARAHFAIETSIVEMTPTSGPAGTRVSIHLKGVGWTEYDNIYAATYDNAYMGYACGFNSQGDVVINFTAAGAPGAHVIDLFPGIYQGPPTEPQQFYRLPQLTYADDHPGNKIPALHFTFEITAGPSRRQTD